MSDGAAGRRVRIWDWPTRLFHWLIVLLIPALWWTAEADMIDRHVTIGKVMLGLVLFRLIWGVIGSSTARFANFVKGPRAVMSYLSGRAAKVLGHNPLGGLSVIAMLAVLAAQVGLGLFASDEDGLYSGPLAHLVSYEASEAATDAHGLVFNLLLALIALHIAAIVFYALIRRRNLIGAMLTGRGAAAEGVEEMHAAPWWRFVAAVILAGAATSAIVG